MPDPLGGFAYTWPLYATAVVAYLLGSIPFGLLLAKLNSQAILPRQLMPPSAKTPYCVPIIRHQLNSIQQRTHSYCPSLKVYSRLVSHAPEPHWFPGVGASPRCRNAAI